MKAEVMSRQLVVKAVRAQVSAQADTWLRAAGQQMQQDLHAIRELFPSVARHCGRVPLVDPPPELGDWTVDEAARVVLLLALRHLWSRLGPSPASFLAEVQELYYAGDAAERRAVLRSLPFLFEDDEALTLVHDALRTNDTRLIRAALGPYARDHLADHDFRHAVLKCVFTGIPLAEISGLDERVDRHLAVMLTDFGHERHAAGRTVPEDVWLVVDRFPDLALDPRLPRRVQSPPAA